MAIQLGNNTGMTRRVPINRNNMFYSEESFEFEREIGKCYVEQDMNQTVVLYQVDYDATNADAVYGETQSDNVRYKTPVEVHCVYNINEPQLKSYDKTKNLGTYQQIGNLDVGVYQESLDELGVDIKIGDYLGVQVNEKHMEFVVVVNDGRVNYSNSLTLYGVKPLYRKIVATPVDKSEFTI